MSLEPNFILHRVSYASFWYTLSFPGMQLLYKLIYYTIEIVYYFILFETLSAAIHYFLKLCYQCACICVNKNTQYLHL